MESALPCGSEKSLSEYLFSGVVRELEVVDTGVYRGVGPLASVHLPHDGQPRREVG